MKKSEWRDLFKGLFSEAYTTDRWDGILTKDGVKYAYREVNGAREERKVSELDGKITYNIILDIFADSLYPVYQAIEGFMDNYPDMYRVVVTGTAKDVIGQCIALTGFELTIDDYWTGVPEVYDYKQLAKDYLSYLHRLKYRGTSVDVGYTAAKAVKEMLLMIVSYAITYSVLKSPYSGNSYLKETDFDGEVGGYNSFLKKAISIIRVSENDPRALTYTASVGQYSGVYWDRINNLLGLLGLSGESTGEDRLKYRYLITVLVSLFEEYVGQLVTEDGEYTFVKESLDGLVQPGVIFGYRNTLPSWLSSLLYVSINLSKDVSFGSSTTRYSVELDKTNAEIIKEFTQLDITKSDDILNYYMDGAKPAGIDLRWSVIAELYPFVYSYKQNWSEYNISLSEDVYNNSRKPFVRYDNVTRGAEVYFDAYSSALMNLTMLKIKETKYLVPLEYAPKGFLFYPSKKQFSYKVFWNGRYLNSPEMWASSESAKWYGLYQEYKTLRGSANSEENWVQEMLGWSIPAAMGINLGVGKSSELLGRVGLSGIAGVNRGKEV